MRLGRSALQAFVLLSSKCVIAEVAASDDDAFERTFAFVTLGDW